MKEFNFSSRFESEKEAKNEEKSNLFSIEKEIKNLEEKE